MHGCSAPQTRQQVPVAAAFDDEMVGTGMAGQCWDNAAAESSFATKRERIDAGTPNLRRRER